jgi:hypothetical protein
MLKGRLGFTLLEVMVAKHEKQMPIAPASSGQQRPEKGKPVSGTIKAVVLLALLFCLVITWGAGIDRLQYHLGLYFVLLVRACQPIVGFATSSRIAKGRPVML